MPRRGDARERARDAGVPEGPRCQCPKGRCEQVATGLRYCDDCFFEAGSDPAECLCECAACKPLATTAADPAAADPVAAREGDAERLRAAGYPDLTKIFQTEDLAPGDDVIFCASGVTDGALLRGVRFFGGGQRVNSLVMTSRSPRNVRFIDNVRVGDAYTGPIQAGGV